MKSGFLLALQVVSLVTLGACGGGGGGAVLVMAPTGLSYAGSTTLVVGTAVSLIPTVTGTTTRWSVSPDLPKNLQLDPVSGAITGTPASSSQATSYTITAANAGGSTTTTLRLSAALSGSDAASAEAAELNASYDIESGIVSLSWTDSFASATGYQLEQQNADGTWAILATVKSGAIPQQAGGPISTTTTFRVEAVLAGYFVPLLTVAGLAQINVVPPSPTPTLIIGGPLPLAVPTPVSISGTQTYTEVDYFYPIVPGYFPTLTMFGSSKAAPSYPSSFDPAVMPSGTYQLQAHLVVDPDVTFTVEQSVQTNPEIKASISFNALTGNVLEEVTASSDYGITQVSSTLDGQSVGSLTAPNFCRRCVNGNDLYAFSINTQSFGSGSHTLVVRITDGNGVVATITQQVVFNNPPVITLTSPIQGSIVYGTVTVSGTATSDKSGGVTTTATFGGSQILSTTSTSFSTSYDISALTPGNYTLAITATDVTGYATVVQETVTVASSSGLAYTPEMTLDGSLLAVDPESFLYLLADGTVHLHEGSTDTVLQNIPSSFDPINWLLYNGNAFATGFGGDRPGSNTSVYQWSSDGTRSNLSILGNSTGVNDQLLAVHDGWVLWSSDFSNFEFYGLSSGLSIVPTTTGGAVNIGADFYVSQGQLALYYWAPVGSGVTNIYRWDQSTGVSTQLSSDGTHAVYPQTDGVRVAWQSSPSGSTCPSSTSTSCSLEALTITSNAEQTLTQILQGFTLADGLIAWKESSSAGGGIKVSDGVSVTTLSLRLSAQLLGVSGGYVLYVDNGKLFVWSSSGGAQVIFDATPVVAMIAGKTVYFTNGASPQALYRVVLQ
jgi:hypothetical protein